MQRLVQGSVLGLCVCSYEGADARFLEHKGWEECQVTARRIARCHLCWLDWPHPLHICLGLAAHKAMACVPPELTDCIADMARLTVKLPR